MKESKALSFVHWSLRCPGQQEPQTKVPDPGWACGSFLHPDVDHGSCQSFYSILTVLGSITLFPVVPRQKRAPPSTTQPPAVFCLDHCQDSHATRAARDASLPLVGGRSLEGRGDLAFTVYNDAQGSRLARQGPASWVQGLEGRPWLEGHKATRCRSHNLCSPPRLLENRKVQAQDSASDLLNLTGIICSPASA